MASTLDKDIIDSIRLMTVNGSRLELPTQQITNYPQVKKALQNAGGVYKKNGFDFGSKDPQEIVDRLTGGEVVNDKKKFQYFPTPKELAAQMVERACLHDGASVLEPSAGCGRLVQAVLDTDKMVSIAAVEANIDHIVSLGLLCNLTEHADFLALDPDTFGRFTHIIANPPFTRNQDIDHVLHMIKFLKPGGRLVTVMSNSWRTGSISKQQCFRWKLKELNAEVEDIDPGVFKESGTNVAACLVVIQLPE